MRRRGLAEKFWIVVSLGLVIASIVAVVADIGFLAWWAIPGGLR